MYPRFLRRHVGAAILLIKTARVSIHLQASPSQRKTPFCSIVYLCQQTLRQVRRFHASLPFGVPIRIKIVCIGALQFVAGRGGQLPLKSERDFAAPPAALSAAAGPHHRQLLASGNQKAARRLTASPCGVSIGGPMPPWGAPSRISKCLPMLVKRLRTASRQPNASPPADRRLCPEAARFPRPGAVATIFRARSLSSRPGGRLPNHEKTPRVGSSTAAAF